MASDRAGMDGQVRRMDAATEYYTPERCYILELSNSADDAAVSIARARVRPEVTTRWHRLHGRLSATSSSPAAGALKSATGPPTTWSPATSS